VTPKTHSIGTFLAAAGWRKIHGHGGNPPKNSEEAYQYLIDGNARFIQGQTLGSQKCLLDDHPTRTMDRVGDVASGQNPFAAILSCADSRVPVELVFDQGFGDVFVTRVAGNIVTNEIIASLEFGVAVLGAKVLLVLGHSSCGAVKATAGKGAVPGVISSLYYSIYPAIAKLGPNATLDEYIEENVRHQVDLLKVSPVLSQLVTEGKLKIVGGVYHLANGKFSEIDH